MSEDLQCLKNLGKTSVQWLKAAGVRTPSDLRRLGAVQAYLAVKARGFGATKVLLFALEGALLDVAWRALPHARKAALLEQLESTNRREAKNKVQ
ncbi:TfoX/Sxy family protein [Pseudomonas putida]|uniref:TfoX/Sxy family protein n=1 Tax=Pseudomonas putida TaxID=303 RepID=UPI0018E6D226|nr:TfoX/Sxy family protein [Pseudomonas putida]MBI6925797.1 TfoX/Sxy family protein [Pseudomonas putida]